MLRPSDSLLYSSRAARRAHVRQERARAVAQGARSVVGIFGDVFGLAWDAAVLFGLPILYLGASYLALDLPARWLFTGDKVTLIDFALFLGSIVVSLIGLARVLQQAQPAQPVTPQFARRALVVGWLFALLLVVADVAA
jgi:hypothetical protein